MSSEQLEGKKVTIVSTLPFVLTERKPGQIPGYYEVEAAVDKDSLGITFIGDAWFPELIPFADTKAPARRMDISAEKVANGVVSDYIGANLAVSHDVLSNGARRLPGIFWVNRIRNEDEVLEFEKTKVKFARLNTIAWFEALVKLADDTWTKYRQHMFITDLQRSAATYLGAKDRDWNVNVIEQMASMSVCPACSTQVTATAMLCHNCRYILNPDLYEKNKSRFATA